MTQRSPVVALTLGLTVAMLLVACSSDEEQGPPATDVPALTIVDDDDDAAPTVAPESADTVGTGTVTTSTGLGSIDGPASVDPDFGGAKPGADNDGG